MVSDDRQVHAAAKRDIARTARTLTTIVDDEIFIVFHRGFVRTEIEFAADEQHRVTDRLSLQSFAVGTPEQSVVGIGFREIGMELRTHSVGARQHDTADKLFDAPAVLYKFNRECVE